MQFVKLDQYQDNQGDCCLRFYFEAEAGVEIEHWLKLNSKKEPFLSLSVNNASYYKPSVFTLRGKEKEAIVNQCLNLIGGEAGLKKLLKEGQPTRVGITLAIADNTGKLQWVGKPALAVGA